METSQRTIGLSCAFLIASCFPAVAQLEVSSGFSFVTPMGEFNQIVESLWGHKGGQRGIGGEVKADWGLGKQSALKFGVFGDVLSLGFGNGTRGDPFGTSEIESYQFSTMGEKSTRLNLLMISSGISISPRRGSLRPYGEFFGGITSYSNSSSLLRVFLTGGSGSATVPPQFRKPYYPESEPLRIEDRTWHAGFTAGLKFLMWPPDQESEKDKFLKQVFIDWSFSYARSGYLEYFDEASILPESGVFIPDQTVILTHEMLESRIEILKMRISLTFGF